MEIDWLPLELHSAITDLLDPTSYARLSRTSRSMLSKTDDRYWKKRIEIDFGLFVVDGFQPDGSWRSEYRRLRQSLKRTNLDADGSLAVLEQRGLVIVRGGWFYPSFSRQIIEEMMAWVDTPLSRFYLFHPRDDNKRRFSLDRFYELYHFYSILRDGTMKHIEDTKLELDQTMRETDSYAYYLLTRDVTTRELMDIYDERIAQSFERFVEIRRDYSDLFDVVTNYIDDMIRFSEDMPLLTGYEERIEATTRGLVEVRREYVNQWIEDLKPKKSCSIQ